MASKELSSFPPDKWIRTVNRKYPNLWTDLRKQYADPGNLFRKKDAVKEFISGTPDWCIMPTLFPFLVLTDRFGELFYMSHMDEISCDAMKILHAATEARWSQTDR